MTLQSKLPQVGTNIFTLMTSLSLENQAINLGQGFPDFSPDGKLIELVHRAMLDGHNQYPAMSGVPALRQQIAAKIHTLYGRKYDPDTEITVTSGATQALMASILALVKPGDEVIVIEPFYDLYLPAIQLAGGIPIIVPMLAPSKEHPSYRVDWQRLSDAISPRTQLMILNFPHNPTGIIMQPADLDALESILQKSKCLLLCDEVYEHITFDAQPHHSVSSRPALAQRAVVVSSFGKTYHVTGWKIGYCSAPAAIMAEIRKVHQFTVFTVSSPMQIALAEFMKDESTYQTLAAFYQKRRDFLATELAATAFKPLPSQGTFFLLADYSDISEMPENEFARWLTTEHKVGVIPVCAFYQNPQDQASNHQQVRFCFAKKDQTLSDALERLKRI